MKEAEQSLASPVSPFRRQAYHLKKRFLARRFLTRPALRIMAAFFQQRAVSLELLRLTRRLGNSQNNLTPRPGVTSGSGKKLANPFLAQLFCDTTLGAWSLDSDTINFLEARVFERRPTAILEFGSGISTVCLAHLMRTIHPQASTVLVYSIEQSAEFASQTRRQLEEVGMANRVKVEHVPLCSRIVEGQETICYDLTMDRLKQLLEGVRPDFCLIDGPIWSTGSRFATIPQAKEFLNPGAKFFLDDALRDRELEIAEAWSHLPYLKVSGIHLVGKGILSGELR